MRRWVGIGCVVTLAALAACQRPITYVPAPPIPALPPAPVEPPKPPPVDPPVDPIPPPAGVAAALDRVSVGMTLAQVVATLGAPTMAPATDGAPSLGRWYVTEGDQRYLVFVVFEGWLVVRKGSSRVEVVR